MYFKELEMENYGIYKGKHHIDFKKSTDGETITLVGGLNGRGKTTLLEAVFLVLYGKRAIPFLQDERISYNKFLKEHINKSTLDKKTFIKLTMECDDEAHTNLTIIRYWCLTASGVNEGFEVLKEGQDDKYLSENWDYYVEEIIPLGIARFFFFDNEKISQIADDDSFDKIKDSIKVLIGITTVDRLIDDMKSLIKRKNGLRDNSSEINQDSQKLVLDQRYSELKDEIRKSVRLCGNIRNELKISKVKLSKNENDFWKFGGQLGLKREQMKAEKIRLQEKMQLEQQKVLDLISNPTIPLLLCNPLLIKTYDNAQQDDYFRAARYSKPLLNTLHQKLLAFVEQLGHKDKFETFVDFLNQEFNEITNVSQKSESFNISPSSQEMFKNILSQAEQVYKQIREYVAFIKDIDNKISQIDMHLNFDKEASTQNLMNSIKDLTHRIGTLEATIQNEETKQRTLNLQMESIEKQRWQLIRKELENKHSDEEVDRMVKYASMTIEVMSGFKKRLQLQRVSQLEKQILECFNFMAQKETVISQIHINPETLDIKLLDYQGGELLKSQLSAGEKQIFAVSILWGLAKCSGYRLPVIVDTPLGRLDSKHRTNFVKRYLPNAGDQVIVLSTDEEIYGRYLSYVKPHINETYTLLYDEIEKATSIIPGYFEEVGA